MHAFLPIHNLQKLLILVKSKLILLIWNWKEQLFLISGKVIIYFSRRRILYPEMQKLPIQESYLIVPNKYYPPLLGRFPLDSISLKRRSWLVNKWSTSWSSFYLCYCFPPRRGIYFSAFYKKFQCQLPLNTIIRLNIAKHT